jgi:dihydroorotate dehydrogenase (fumarate)/dihydroorotate dehydrogenase
MTSLYPAVLRPLLFRLSADRAHAMAQAALRWAAPWRLLAGQDMPRQPVNFAGVALANPVGLAAGFDKDAEMMAALSTFGFGFVTVGSLMAEPRFGNPFPRLVRYPETLSLADSMGLPSKGLPYALARLRRYSARRVPVFANVAGFTAREIVGSVRAVEPLVDGVEINLLCPNVAPGDRFDEMAFLRDVLDRLAGHTRPLVVRLPNDTVADADRRAEFLELCIAGGVNGVKIGGGRPVAEPRLGTGQGTLHGQAIFERALGHVAAAASVARGRIDIKGNGGVGSAAQVRAMLRAGACCIDLYSALIYQGWGVARAINRDLQADQAV